MQQISDDRIIQAIRDRGLDPTPDLIERTRQQVQARMATSQTPKAVQSADPTRGVAAYDAFLRSQGAALGRQPKPEEGGGFIDIVQAGGAEGMARMFRTIDFATGMDKEPGGFVEGAQKYFEGVAAAPENQPRAGEEDTFTNNLARAIGNMAAFSIPAIAGGAAGTLIGGPAGTVAGISAATLGAGAAASATGGAVEYVNAYDEVMKSTGDEELATSAGLWAGLGGLTEGLDAALPVLGKIGKVLTRADKATGGAITDGIMKFGAKRMSSAVIGGAAMNFAQETGQEVWSDAVINHFKGNPSDAKEILQSFKQYAWSMGLPSALIGGAFGGLQGKLEQIQGEEEFKKFAAARAEGRVEREGLKPVGVVEREPGTEGPEFVPSDPLFKKTQEELKAAGDAGILREVEAPKELSYLADLSEKKGSRVRFVETAEGSAFRGVYDPETGDILLNVNRPDDAIDFTFGHELGGHALKRLSGDAFATFRNKVQQLDPAGLAAAEKMARERQPGIAENADLVAEEGQSYYIEEVLGPWMRSIAKNPDGAAILESIAVDDRSMFRKIGEVVLDLFNDMGANFNTRRQTLKNLLGTPDLIGSEVAAGRGLSQQKAAQLALSLHGLMEGMDAGVYQRDVHQRRVEEFRARREQVRQEYAARFKAFSTQRNETMARSAEAEKIRLEEMGKEEQRRAEESAAREAADFEARKANAVEKLRLRDTLRGYAAEDERRAKRAEREQAAEKKLRELQQATQDARYQSALERYAKERELTEAQRAQFEADFARVEGMGTAAQQRAALNEMSSPTQRKVAQESGKGTRLESKKDVAARQAEAARLEPIVQENERSEQERRLSEERTRARAAALEQEARLATAEELGARMEAGMAEQEPTAAEREAALAEQAAEQRRGIEAQSVAEARAREQAARELNRERKVTGRTQDAWRRYEDASNAYRTGGPIEEGVGSTGAVRARRVHEIAALERQGLRGDRTSHPLSYATVPELRRMLAANLADESRAAQQAFGDERMAAAYNELQRKARDPNNPEARSARRQLERMWSNLSEDQKLTLTGAGSRRGVFRPFSTEEITDALNARELGQQGKLTDVGMGPRFSMGDVQSRYEAALREVEAFKDGGSLVSDEAWGAIHHKLASERSPNDWMKAVEFSRENGILPYVSAGKYDIPVQINRDIRFSIAAPKKGDVVHEGTGLVLNKNGTVTLYYPTTNADARRVIRDRTLVAQNPSSSVLYLTNESNGMKVNAERGVIDQPTDGANVLVNIDPNLLSVAREYPDGRKDYFVPISEGKAFDGKLRQIRLFTLNVERNKAISEDITLKKMSDSIAKAVSEYEKMDAKAKRARLSEAKRVLREQHNVGNLLTVNKKLEKTEVNESLIQKVGRMVSTAGLGLSSAQRLNKSKLSTCPNAAICKDLCLGETSGLNELYGGVGAQRSGPRLSQYLKTEAMVLHPEEFAVVLYSEIAKLQASAQSQNRISSIRLNVTSDFHPFVWESMILAFPETIFYDYSKLDSDAIAPNHHITYSSTGLSQIVDGAPVLNQYQNWMKMTRRMNQGFNTAMAFSTREYLPESLIDDVTGVEYKVIDGDDYDARFADKQPDGQPGVIVGLRNKDNTQKPGGPSSVKTNGFFVHYDPAVHGRSLIVLNQDTLQPSQRETNAPQVRPQQQGGVVERPQAPQGGLPAEASGGNRLVEGQAPEARFSLGGFASFSDALDDVRKRGDIATQSFRTTFVDYLNETKKLLEAAAKAPYQKIEAMQRTLGRRGISSARIKDEVTPRFNKLVDAMRSAGVSHGDVADFMRARVQPIAEKVVKERRSKMDPTGTMYEAQITATEAADIMKRLKAQPNYGDIVRIVKMVDDVNQRALDINLASGKIDRDSYDKMMAQYDPAVQGMANPEGFKTFYGSLESMPERSVVDSALMDVPGIGRGVGRTGRPYRGRTGVLKGSDVELKSPVVNAFVGLQNAVIRGVKSEEQRSYAKLVKDLNDPTFAVIHETLPTEDVVGSDGYVHRVPKGDWAEQEGWLPYIENGKWKAIEFKGANKLIAEDLKAKTVSAPIRGVSEVTRKVASLMTRLDPTFMLRNIPRDWGWAFLAGTSKYGTAFTKAMASEYKPALKDLWAVKRGGAPSGLLKQYFDAGAEISSMGFKNYEDNLADLEKALSAKDPNLATKIQNTWESWVGETNDVLENATRYAAFRAAVREGKSVGEAMLVAKEGVALNFEQTGRVGRPINSAFAFFNAGVNGTDAIIRLLTKEGDAGTRARRMAASVVGMGIAAELLNRMVSEDGDDEVPVYDNISEFEKNRNFLFMRPDGSYFKVPIPFGFNAVYAFGRNMAAYMSGARSAMAAATDSVSFAMESASPFGSGPMLQVISPTLLDPIVQWKTNETFTGSKIAPDLEQFGRQTKAPHEIFWKNTADMPKEIAELVAEVTEVGDSGRGFIDFRPDMLEHWASSYMGGVGRAAIDLSNTIGAAYKGEAPDAREAFAVRHFIGEASPYAIDKRYRDTRSEIEQVEARYKQLIEEGDRPTALRWRAANAQLFRASGTLKSIERALDKIPNTPENEERRRTIKARLVRQTGYTQE